MDYIIEIYFAGGEFASDIMHTEGLSLPPVPEDEAYVELSLAKIYLKLDNDSDYDQYTWSLNVDGERDIAIGAEGEGYGIEASWEPEEGYTEYLIKESIFVIDNDGPVLTIITETPFQKPPRDTTYDDMTESEAFKLWVDTAQGPPISGKC